MKNVYVLINDYGIETTTRNGLIDFANEKIKKALEYGLDVKYVRNGRQAKEYLEKIGYSVTITELFNGFNKPKE